MIHFHTHSTSVFDKIKLALMLGTLFLIPLFFLTSTQEFFTTNKFYLLGFVSLALIATSTVEFIVTKKIEWLKRPMDNVVILFLISVVLSTIIISPNKIQALLNPNFGFVVIFALTTLYFYLSRNKMAGFQKMALAALQLSAVVLSLIEVFFFFQPLKTAHLPTGLSFLQNAYFTPVGNPLDLMIFLGFVAVISAASIVMLQKSQKEEMPAYKLLHIVSLVLSVVGFALTAVAVFKPFQAAGGQPALLLPPFRISWYGAVEILKAPLNALFGVGVDNFAFLFNHAKDAAYNQSASWQVSSFSVASSTLLHIVSEAGLVSLLAMIALLLSNLRTEVLGLKANGIKGATPFAIGFFAMLLVVILLPPSLMVFFLLFVVLAMLTLHRLDGDHDAEPSVMNVEKLLPVYGVLLVAAVLFLAGSSYGLIQSYRAENFFKKSLDGYLSNSAQALYDNQRQAILINPYIERFRINFSQTNLLIANNIASKAINQNNGNTQNAGSQLSDADKNTIAQAIQAAISEAKAAVALNEQKASNWDNLATIYRNVLNVADGADTWTVTAYQRAILLDPQNAVYRLNLGGVYFSLKDYADAASLFQQAAQLKPDWANAHYNLAYAAYQGGNFQLAATEMQNALYLVDPKTDPEDYKKIQSDLEEFKKKVPAQQETQNNQQTQTNGSTEKVGLPTPPVATISPKLKIKDAEPPATSQKEGGSAADQAPTVAPIVSPTTTP